MNSIKVLNNALTVFLSALPLVLFCFFGGENALFTAVAVVIHECAHLIALRIFGGRILSFKAAPFGLCINYDSEGLSLLAETAVCAAGCIANILSAVISFSCYAIFRADFVTFGIVSLSIALMNLIPIYPLDGYRIVYLILAMLVSPFKAESIAFIISGVFGFLFFAVSSYMLVTSVCGVYPLLFSIYIFSVNSKIMSKSEGF